MKVTFTKDVMVNGVKFPAGSVCDSECTDKPIPSGNLTSMLSVGWIEEASELDIICEPEAVVVPEAVKPPKIKRPAKGVTRKPIVGE